MLPPSSLTFELVQASGHGRDVLRARLDGQTVGELHYSLMVGPVAWIHWLEVIPAYRRRGIAGALRDELTRRFPWARIDTGGLSAEGAAFEAGRSR